MYLIPFQPGHDVLHSACWLAWRITWPATVQAYSATDVNECCIFIASDRSGPASVNFQKDRVIGEHIPLLLMVAAAALGYYSEVFGMFAFNSASRGLLTSMPGKINMENMENIICSIVRSTVVKVAAIWGLVECGIGLDRNGVPRCQRALSTTYIQDMVSLISRREGEDSCGPVHKVTDGRNMRREARCEITK